MLGVEDYPAFVAEVFGDGREPFPWQTDLLAQVVTEGRWPDVVDIPTGLGKTSSIDMAVFALAVGLAQGREDVPTRTFFVIDRRIVVDSAFAHATQVVNALRDAEATADQSSPRPVCRAVAAALRRRAGADAKQPLAAVRMRGGVTWGWRWLRQPDQPAVVVGTVDQYGSRLLFRGYGVGPRLRPIDAALCGTDALVLVDEAHLCGPLLDTMASIDAYEATAPEHPLPGRPVRVVTLSATTRRPAVNGEEEDHGDGPRRFELTPERWRQHLEESPEAARRLRASKRATLVACDPKLKKRSQLADVLTGIARTLVDERGARRVGVVANTVQVARDVFDQLQGDGRLDAHLLVGRVRPYERAGIERDVVAAVGAGRGGPDGSDDGPGQPVVVIATQTIEVGADLDFDALVTEAAPLDALIQRFGRVARRGEPAETDSVVVFAPSLHTADDPVYGAATQRTWDLLVHGAGGDVAALQGRDRFKAGDIRHHVDFGPSTLRALRAGVDLSHFVAEAPEGPPVLGATLDAWARTEPAPLPDQPVAPFLHGFERPTDSVLVCWRADLNDGADPETWCGLVESLPPRQHELVEVPRRELISLLRGEPVEKPLADVAVVGDAEPDVPRAPRDGGRPAWVRHVVYRGRGDSHVGTDPSRLPPGTIVVLPSSAGGHDRHGWTGTPGGPVLDIAELEGRSVGRVLRLDHAVLGPFVDVPDSLRALRSVHGTDRATADDIADALSVALQDLAKAVARRSPAATAPEATPPPEPGEEVARAGAAPAMAPAPDAVTRSRFAGVVGRFVEASDRNARHIELIDRSAGQAGADDPGRPGDTEASRATPHLLVRLSPAAERDLREDDGNDTAAGEMQAGDIEETAAADLDDVDDCDAASTSWGRSRMTLADHSIAVGERAEEIARRLGLPPPVQRAVRVAGLAHDVGKVDPRFQAILFGNRWAAEAAAEPIAKSGRIQRQAAGPRFGWPAGMRHEALSGAVVADWASSPGFPTGVDPDLVTHLVATHHGWARPLFRPVVDTGLEPFDVTVPGTTTTSLKVTGPEAHTDWDGPERFARLTKTYGRWGLALLEAIVRLADIACSEEDRRPAGIGRAAEPSPPDPGPGPDPTESHRHSAARRAQREALPAADVNEIPLPALRNDEALGFLAALGLVSVLELGSGASPRLGWAGVGQEAVLVMDEGWDLDRVVGELEGFVDQLSIDDGRLVHPLLEGFPLVKEGAKGSDPMRMSFADASGLAAAVAEREWAGDPVWGRWYAGTLNLCAPLKPGEAVQALTPLYAPTGNQTFDRNLKFALTEVQDKPRHLREALVGWRRVDGFAGANLDHRAERNAATIQDTVVKNHGVPGATWLALMSIPQLRLTGDGRRSESTLFQRPGRGRALLTWPLWRRPLDPFAIRTLVEHPALRLRRPAWGSVELAAPASELRALGVEAVAWAQRSSLGNSEGPFGPATLVPVP